MGQADQSLETNGGAKMIKSIRLQNFQSHKDTLIHFDDGINVITGQSDTGKSSVIRAVKWVTENRPLGDAIRSNFTTDDTVVTIEMDDGQTVSRTRGKSTNNYTVNGLVFEAVGTSVPQEVTEAFNLQPINIQYQLDQPFLLSTGSGDVAQYINKIVRIDVIDRTISDINRKIKKTNTELSSTDTVLLDTETQLESYAGLEELETKIEAAEATTTELAATSKRLQGVQDLVLQIKDNKSCVHTKEDALRDLVPGLLACEKTKTDLTNLTKRRMALTSVIEIIKKTEATKKIATKQLQTLGNLEPIIVTCRLAKEKAQTRVALQSQATELRTLHSRIRTLTIERDEADADYQKEIPDICPTCEQLWKKAVPVRVRKPSRNRGERA